MTDSTQPTIRSERVDDKPKRRQYTPEYKLRILQEVDESREERGAIGRILRREGLYAAQVAIWRRDLEEQIGRGAQFGESGQRFGSIRPVTLGVFGVSRVQCNQVVGLVRNPPLLDAPLRAIRWQFSRSLSQMASAAPASPMTLPHFSMGT
jgi:transposase-like protein